MERKTKLTDRQVAVLAAVERLGESTLPQIKAQFAGLNASDVLRVLDALIRRGLVEWCGDPHLVYLGDAPVAVIDDDDVVRFRATPLDR